MHAHQNDDSSRRTETIRRNKRLVAHCLRSWDVASRVIRNCVLSERASRRCSTHCMRAVLTGVLFRLCRRIAAVPSPWDNPIVGILLSLASAHRHIAQLLQADARLSLTR